jgi:recombination protein RecA
MAMSSASVLRAQIEASLTKRIPSALTPSPRIIRPVSSSGITALDDLLEGGLPLGALTEIVGSECSGRTSFALSFIAQVTKAEKVCAWIDVSDTLNPESAAAVGVTLKRLLWVRCGVPPTNKLQQRQQTGFVLPEKYLTPKPAKKGLHGGGFGPHPRGEVKGLSNAVSGLLHHSVVVARCAEPQRRTKDEGEVFRPNPSAPTQPSNRSPVAQSKPLSRIEQALCVTDLLLQGGGFGAIVLDMGSVAPEDALRVPMATWFKYRAAAEKSQASVLLLTQHPCAKSSAELVLRLQTSDTLPQNTTVLSGIRHHIEVSRQRFTQTPSNIIPLRKPPQKATSASWDTRTTWAGIR